MNRQDVGFLLALGALPLGCGDDDDGTTGGDVTGSAAGSNGSMTAAGTSGDTDAGTGTQTTTTATSVDDTDGETAGGDVVCEQYAAWYVQCYPRYASYAGELRAYCESSIEYGTMVDGPACGAAIEDFFACLSDLDCDSDDADCHAEDQAAAVACPNAW